MTAFLDDLPVYPINSTTRRMNNAVTATSQSASSPEYSVPEDFSRRAFMLRTALVAGGALAITCLAWIGERTRAFAVTRTSRHPTHCIGVNRPGDVACWGRTYISNKYCASDGYHRTDAFYIGSTLRRYYWEPACQGYAGWYWYSSNYGTSSCWDGYWVDYYSGVPSGRYTTSCIRSGS